MLKKESCVILALQEKTETTVVCSIFSYNIAEQEKQIAVVWFARWSWLCSGKLSLGNVSAGPGWSLQFKIEHLSPRLINPRQWVDMPNDRHSPVCRPQGPEADSQSTVHPEDGASLACPFSRLEREVCGPGQMALTTFMLLSLGGSAHSLSCLQQFWESSWFWICSVERGAIFKHICLLRNVGPVQWQFLLDIQGGQELN